MTTKSWGENKGQSNIENIAQIMQNSKDEIFVYLSYQTPIAEDGHWRSKKKWLPSYIMICMVVGTRTFSIFQ